MSNTKKRLCPNCGCEVFKQDSVFIRTGRVQVMKEVLHSGFAADVYCCPSCGKLELYKPEQQNVSTPGTAQRTCPQCGNRHDFDYSRCPLCGFEY
ncbi:MAG: hypothetical protein LIO95_05430 [Clostridiales bacterium]|nr:hypothetical protein [Clostridiales bacterium]